MTKNKITERTLHGILFAYRYPRSPLGKNDEGYLGEVVQFSGQPGLIFLNKNKPQGVVCECPELSLKRESKKRQALCLEEAALV